jgi:DNA polymerase
VTLAAHGDFETKSVLDLREVALHNYVRHPTTDVWCLSWAIGDMEPEVWTPGQPCPERLRQHIEAGGEFHAWNAPFEMAVWAEIMVKRYGFPPLKPEQVFCVMAKSYAMGLPGALEDAALALGLHVLKDTEGRSLMLRMARPRKVHYRTPESKGVPLWDHNEHDTEWWDEPEKRARLYAYCQQDTRVEREVDKRLMPLSEKERRIWLLDYKINQKGIAVDRPSAEAAIRMAEKLKTKYDAQMADATGGAAQTCNALIPIKQWLNDHGCPVDSLAKQDLADLLPCETLTSEVRRVLTLRQEAAKASTAKFAVMTKIAGGDDRVRNLFQYHGAATGRWAGRKVQAHNLPRDVPPTEIVDRILEHVRNGGHEAIDLIYGSPMTVLSRCLRGFFVPAKGKLLVGGDYSAIEGRGTAWIAGEEWKLKAFRAADAGTGPGIYELGASRILHVPVETIKDPSFERQAYGKVPELALGYQGGVGAFQTMAKTYGVQVTDEEAERIKLEWRALHPKTKATWSALQDAAVDAVRRPGEVFQAGHPSRPVKFKKVGSFLWCLLPSGRALCYPYPKLLPGKFGEQLTYMTVPSPDDKKKGKIIADPHNTATWARVGTYGGSLLENVVQAVCRDLLAEAMLRLDDAGWDVVLHVHDEIVSEEGIMADPQNMTAIMGVVPEWAREFPIAVKCKAMTRYGK